MHRAIGVNGTTPRSAAVPATPTWRVPVVLPEAIHRITADVRPVTDARRVTDRLASLRDHRLVGELTSLIDREAPLVFRFDAESSAWLLVGAPAPRVAAPLHWRTPATVDSDPAGVPPAGEAVAASPSGGRTSSCEDVHPTPDRLTPDQESSRRGTLPERLGRVWASSRATARLHRRPRYGTTTPNAPGAPAAPDATLQETPARAARAVQPTEGAQGDEGTVRGRPRPAASPSVPQAASHPDRPASTPADPVPEPAAPRPASPTTPARTVQTTPAAPVPTTAAQGTAQDTAARTPANAAQDTAPAASRTDPRTDPPTAQTSTTDTAQATAAGPAPTVPAAPVPTTPAGGTAQGADPRTTQATAADPAPTTPTAPARTTAAAPAPQHLEVPAPAAVRGADTVVSAAVPEAVVPVADRSSGVAANPPGAAAEETHRTVPAARGSATSQPRDPAARAADAASAPLTGMAEDTPDAGTPVPAPGRPPRTSSVLASPDSPLEAPASSAAYVPDMTTGLVASATGSDVAPVETVGEARPSRLRSFRWVAGARTAVRRRLRREPRSAPENVPDHPVPARATAEPSPTAPKPRTATDAAGKTDPATGSPGASAVGTNTGSATGALEPKPVNSEAGAGEATTTGPAAAGGTPRRTSAQEPGTAPSQGRPEAAEDSRPVVGPAPTRSGAETASRPSAEARPQRSRPAPRSDDAIASAPVPAPRPSAPQHTADPAGPSTPPARTTTPAGAVLTTSAQRHTATPNVVSTAPAVAARPSELRSFRWIAGAGTAVRRRLRREPRSAPENVPDHPVPARATAEPSPTSPEARTAPAVTGSSTGSATDAIGRTRAIPGTGTGPRTSTSTVLTAGPETETDTGTGTASYQDTGSGTDTDTDMDTDTSTSVRGGIPEHTSDQEPGTAAPQDRSGAVLRARPVAAADHRHPVAGPVVPRRAEARTAADRVSATRPTPSTDQRQAAPPDVDTTSDTTFDRHDDAHSAAVAPAPVSPRSRAETASRPSAEARPRPSRPVPPDSARQSRADSSAVESADGRTLPEHAADASEPGVLPAPTDGRSATEAVTGPRQRRSGGAPATVTAPAETAPPVHPQPLTATTDATDSAQEDPPTRSSRPGRSTSTTRQRGTTGPARVPADEQRSSDPVDSPASRTPRPSSEAPRRAVDTSGATISATTADSAPVPLGGPWPAEGSTLPAPRRRGATTSRPGGLVPEAQGNHAPGAAPARRIEDAPAPAASVQEAQQAEQTRQAREDDAPSVSDASRHRAVPEATPTAPRRPVARRGDGPSRAASAATGVPAAPERPVAVPATTLAPAPVVPHDEEIQPRTGSNDAPRPRRAGAVRLPARPALQPDHTADTTRSALPARPGTPSTASTAETPAHSVTTERAPRDHSSAGGVRAGGSVSPAASPHEREHHEHHKSNPPAPRQAQRRPAPAPAPMPMPMPKPKRMRQPSHRPDPPVPDVPGGAPDAAPHAPSGAAPFRFAGPAARRSSPRSPQVATRTVRAPRSTGTGTAPSYGPRRGPLGHATETAVPEADAVSVVPSPFLASGAARHRGPLVTDEALPCSWLLTPFGPPGRPRLMQPAPDPEPEPVSPSEFAEGHAVFRPIATTEPLRPSGLPDGHAVFRPISTQALQALQAPRVQPYDISESVRETYAPKHAGTAPEWGIPPGIRSPEEEASS
ncbi:hypothetical protein ACODT5_01740 [Streptomyces sp. 5.8]|uniref:hypothetical protein n=1 Tax=Streptomyces sp. 5.8 TaxID=3406571 RepID=UPI003BB4F101